MFSLQDYSNELFYEMTLTQNMLDDDSLRQLAYIEEEKKLLAVLEKKCNEYEVLIFKFLFLNSLFYLLYKSHKFYSN